VETKIKKNCGKKICRKMQKKKKRKFAEKKIVYFIFKLCPKIRIKYIILLKYAENLIKCAKKNKYQ